MSIAIHSDRTDYTAGEEIYQWNNHPGHSLFFGTNPVGESHRSYLYRSASGSTVKYFGEYVRPSLYWNHRISKRCEKSDFFLHGAPLCYESRTYASLRAHFGAEYMLRGLPTADGTMPLVPDFLVARADDRALAQVTANMAENIGQYRDSLKQADRLFLQGYKLLADFKNATRGKSVQFAASLWLQYQFGIKPLVSDVQALLRTKLGRPGVVTSKGVAMDAWDRRPPSNILWEVLVFLEGTKWGCNTMITCTLDSPWLALLNELGLVNPWALAWELTPFSFVVDWFINIGQVLTSLSASMGYIFLWGSRTRWLKSNYSCRWRPALAAGQTFVGSGWFEEVRGTSYHREVLAGFPIPPLSFKPSLTLENLLDSFALLKAK